ncbi:GDYXXLXY domain-containing protein [Fictibacillus aquaticus]|uniref:GDYXXLXY domain-containing protein n=1 Tax=Fictibacillus aquaticus TaxID=2021314 RepID=A0A235F759_9BACL|nr:GDYXXLXY domain-containing protein [Fictibacillus aquaticus]OYD56863.1 hypothetical protein CGZ90_15015 [Fictibacillus aquaticus]
MKKLSWKLAVAIQLAVLLLIAGSYYAADMFGREIAIKTKPVDPSDILYGDYVILNYDISEVDTSMWPGEWEHNDKTVFVTLTEKDGIYSVKELSKNRPDVDGSDVVLKANAYPSWNGTKDTIGLQYGLERFYVEDNTGKALEEKAGDLTAIVKVAPWGQVKLVELKD